MNYILKKLAQRKEQNMNRFLAYTDIESRVSDGWRKISNPYEVWKDENRNMIVR